MFSTNFIKFSAIILLIFDFLSFFSFSLWTFSRHMLFLLILSCMSQDLSFLVLIYLPQLHLLNFLRSVFYFNIFTLVVSNCSISCRLLNFKCFIWFVLICLVLFVSYVFLTVLILFVTFNYLNTIILSSLVQYAIMWKYWSNAASRLSLVSHPFWIIYLWKLDLRGTVSVGAMQHTCCGVVLSLCLTNVPELS